MAGKYQNAFSAGPSRSSGSRSLSGAEETAPVNHAHEQMLQWLQKVRFRKKLIGGVNEADLWRKLAELNSLYEAALSAERARYDALLAEYLGSPDPGKGGEYR